jgi:putative oxygen-independent coproporphyrinogen III oxidase
MTVPRSLYVHIPWCVRKCPYCDFNSHELAGQIPDTQYVDLLLQDLTQDLGELSPQSIRSIFIGGGTPSLFTPTAMTRLMTGIASQVEFSPNIEITMEANPGTVTGEAGKFEGFRSAGINRLSLGVQSFQAAQLQALGRIHDGDEASRAFALARRAGFDNINLDLMHGLPGQDLSLAMRDLAQAIALGPEHISWYQLTIEPNTVFYKNPPVLGDEDDLWEIYETGIKLLATHGYDRYEISAFAKTGHQSRHNLNYWQFGDYVGIGAGAHGKITTADGIVRTAKTRLPRDYMHSRRTDRTPVVATELPLEFLMNALRLIDGFPRPLFSERTGLPDSALDGFLQRARKAQLLEPANSLGTELIKPTDLGLQFLNNLLMLVDDDRVPLRVQTIIPS